MVHIPYSPKPVSLEKTNRIIQQMKSCICLININNNDYNDYGTGFFCNIPYKGKQLKVLITANHILDPIFLKEQRIVKFELNGNLKEIIINDNRKIYSSEKYDITMIEIIPSEDGINDFLELDEDLFKEKPELHYENESFYLLQYLNTDYVKGVSYGKEIKFSEYEICHYCSSEKASGGAPILNLKNNEVVGVHFGFSTRFQFNKGTYLKYPIEDFQRDNNLIKIYNEYNDKDFSNLKLISSGSYGDIYSAYSIKDKIEICLKKINTEKMKLNYELNELKNFQQDLNNEINILKYLSYNKNSVKYFGDYNNEKEKIIIMEKCDKNLREFVKQKGNALTIKEIKSKFEKLNILFKIIQNKKIIHRDLKLENFLIKYNKEKTDYIIKLGDYGIGKFKFQSNGIFSGLKGTIDTVAPEIILEKIKEYNSSVDIFSLGIILYQLSHNLKHPFGKNSNQILINYNQNYDKDNLNIEFDESIKNNNFKDLIKKMIKLNPKNRLSWEKYFNHPFFK